MILQNNFTSSGAPSALQVTVDMYMYMYICTCVHMSTSEKQ